MDNDAQEKLNKKWPQDALNLSPAAPSPGKETEGGLLILSGKKYEGSDPLEKLPKGTIIGPDGEVIGPTDGVDSPK